MHNNALEVMEVGKVSCEGTQPSQYSASTPLRHLSGFRFRSNRSPRGGRPIPLDHSREEDKDRGSTELERLELERLELERPLGPRLLSRLADLFTTHDLQLSYGAAVEEGESG